MGIQTSTSWKQGQSGNPSGLRKDGTPPIALRKRISEKGKRPIDVKALARASTPTVIRMLRKAVRGKDVPWSVRVHAGEVLLDRAYGKPLQTIDITAILGAFDLTRLSDEQLQQWEELCHEAAGPQVDKSGLPAIIEGELADMLEDEQAVDMQSDADGNQAVDIAGDVGGADGSGYQPGNAVEGLEPGGDPER